MNLQHLVNSIAALPPDWHGCGTVDRNVLDAIVRHVAGTPEIKRSVETGSGCTTLLLSHLSQHHSVFAIDSCESISQVRSSPLFNSKTTVYFEGPTQRTLPTHNFTEPHQLVLLDGPHAYPFPDLEYYFLYPTIDEGGLLIIDDAKIPSIGRMCDILKADEMFVFLEAVNDNTLFFRRTGMLTFNPEGDEWFLQGYNKPYYVELFRKPPNTRVTRFLRRIGPKVPQRVIHLLPPFVRSAMLKKMY